MAAKQQGGLIRKNEQYDDFVGGAGMEQQEAANAGISVLTANEEPTSEEMYHYHEMYADFMEALYDNNSRNVEQMIGSSEQLYEGVSEAAITLLRPVYQAHEQKEGEVPQAALFGEGGMIHTAVEEVFQFAQAAGIDGSQSQDQYTAAHVDMMRKVGEFIEKKSDDSAVEEAQDLMVDVEMADPNYSGSPEMSTEDTAELKNIATQNEQIAQESDAGNIAAEQAPVSPEEAEGMAQAGGLV